jgi:hypothetical protein
VCWWPVLIVFGLLLFCHGCHGDEDNELFVRSIHGTNERAIRLSGEFSPVAAKKTCMSLAASVALD